MLKVELSFLFEIVKFKYMSKKSQLKIERGWNKNVEQQKTE